jgi:pyridoxine 5'-phosphate synthase PdxJ
MKELNGRITFYHKGNNFEFCTVHPRNPERHATPTDKDMQRIREYLDRIEKYLE